MGELVPIVDLGAWYDGGPEERRGVAEEVDAACRLIGFLQVRRHRIPDDTIASLVSASEQFFDLPLDDKLALAPPTPEINRGYARKGSENLTYSLGAGGALGPADLFEAFNVGPDAIDESDPAVRAELHRLFAPNIWPDSLTALRPAVTAYFDEARRVALTLLDVFAVALGLGDRWFRPFATHSTNTMR